MLYASSTRFGALLETLARFRPDLAAVAGMGEIEKGGDTLAAGTVPCEWSGRRGMDVAELAGAYADIGAATSRCAVYAHSSVYSVRFLLISDMFESGFDRCR